VRANFANRFEMVYSISSNYYKIQLPTPNDISNKNEIMSYIILVKYHDSPPESACWLILPPLFVKRGGKTDLSGFGVSKKM